VNLGGFIAGALASFVWWGFSAIFGVFFFNGLIDALVGVFLGVIVARRS
jgi:hypothetical protein